MREVQSPSDFPMMANPGGALPPEQIIGRDELVHLSWQVLEVQSLRVENERRLGKTSVIRLIERDPRPGSRCILMEVGGLSSVEEFIEEVLGRVDDAFPEKSLTLRTMFRDIVHKHLPGAQILGLRVPDSLRRNWRTLLIDTMRMIPQAVGDRVVFLWDEMPWMLQKIRDNAATKSEGRRRVVDLLDTLRDIRQQNPAVRMVFTGSIGFHHVLDEFEDERIAARPVNDMRRIEVGPLSHDDAVHLSLRLIAGERVVAADPPAIAEEIARLTGCVPYYIHHLVVRLAEERGPVDASRIEKIVDRMLTEPGDPWDMRHFLTRLGSYYRDWEEAAIVVLDRVAESRDGLALGDLMAALAQSRVVPPPGLDRDGGIDQHKVLNLLRKLMLDHYLCEDKGYAFKFPLLRRWWILYRRIGG